MQNPSTVTTVLKQGADTGTVKATSLIGKDDHNPVRALPQRTRYFLMLHKYFR